MYKKFLKLCICTHEYKCRRQEKKSDFQGNKSLHLELTLHLTLETSLQAMSALEGGGYGREKVPAANPDR